MTTMLESTKTKIAKRVIEVFEYFDDEHQTATVMDIVRRYGRPQSSTSELLSSLVEMGLLYKEPRSRSYWPTPRLAVMGTHAQPAAIREGHLFAFMDGLARATRHSVALFGMVGVHLQIFHWAPAPDQHEPGLHRGSSEVLSASTAGHLLLSTLSQEQSMRILHRLNAEASADEKFNVAKLDEQVAQYRHQGHATGCSGFIPGQHVTATLLPGTKDERPLAIGFIYPEGAAVDPRALLGTLERGLAACDAGNRTVPPLMMAV